MNEYPAIKVTLLFIVGILTQYFFHLNNKFLLLLILSLLIIILPITFLYIKNNGIKIITLAILLLLTGAFFYSSEQIENNSYPFNLAKIRNSKILAEVESIELIKKKKLTLNINLISFGINKLTKQEHYNFICNLWKDTTNHIDSLYYKIKIGNKLSFLGTIKRANNRRNPNEFDYEKYLKSKNIAGIINCYRPESIDIIDDNQYLFPNFIFNFRRAIDSRIKLLYNKKASALLKGLLLADRNDIDYEIKKNFMDTGVIHVLAVSGLHVGFISLIFFFLFARFGIRYQFILTILGILFFLILTEGHSSVFRASVMAITFLIAKLTNRSTNGINSLAIAALIILLISPKELFNPGFLLSFSAVLSILILYPILSKKILSFGINKFLKKFLLFLTVTFVAQLGTLPFTLIYFNKLSLVSLFANLFVIPLIGVIVGIAILSLSVSIFSVWFASFFAVANMLLIDILYFLVSKISVLSFAFIPIYNFSILDGIFFYVFLTIVFFAIHKFQNKLAFILVFVLAVFSFYNYIQLDNKNLLPEYNLSVDFIDVGQGDGILVKFPNNKTALIDAGNRSEYFDTGERIIIPLLKRLGIDKLDYVFISHLDTDHFGGVISLIENGIVKFLYKPIKDSTHKEKVFENYLKEMNVPFAYYSKSKIEIGGCNLYFLNDTTDNIYKSFDINNKSGIIKLVYGKTSFLFVGDLEEEGEYYLVNKYNKFLKSDILKVGHHGSKTSSSNYFLDAVNPDVGIISAGILNKFHHPSKNILKRLKQHKIKIRRTDKEGAIILTSNGNTIQNINWRNN